MDNLVYRGREDRNNLETLKRALGRATEVEQNEEAYRRQIDALKAACLTAPWRKENRSDGLGALEHQIDGAIHLAVVKQGLLGDKRGLGKTLTNLIWLDLIESQKSIVLCPSDTMDNYIREIKMWTPHRRVVKIGGLSKGERDFILPQLVDFPEFCVVLNYEAWRKDPQLIEDLIALKADTLVEDEAHRAKTLTTNTCKGVTKIRFGANKCKECDSDDIQVKYKQNQDLLNFESDEHYCRSCGHTGIITEFCSIQNVMPMTGTPILNKPQELFPHLRMIDVKNFHTEREFLYDFCLQVGNTWRWGYNAEKRLAKQIGNKYIARDRKSAGVIIPPATPVEHLITMKEMAETHPRQYKAYRQAKEAAELVFDPEKKIVMGINYAIVQIMRLRQVLVWPASISLDIKDPESDEFLYKAWLDVEESIKLDKAEDLMKDIVEEGERVVLFSQFKSGLHVLKDRLLSAGIKAVIYDGDTSSYKRNEIQLDFDPKTAPKDPRWDVVLCNYKAAGEGLNLHSASQMIIIDEEWNPGRQDQSYGRIDRLGQVRETTIHTIRVENSIDTVMQKLIQTKRDMIEGFEEEATIMQSMYDALRNGEM
jgi:SNF2 family DNA or RNA helicase